MSAAAAVGLALVQPLPRNHAGVFVAHAADHAAVVAAVDNVGIFGGGLLLADDVVHAVGVLE